jgi:hypothetical protein
MIETHREIARAWYDGIVEPDAETLARVLSPDVVWHYPGRNPMGGSYRGIDLALRQVAALHDRTGGTLRLGLHDVTASQHYAMVQVTVEASRAGLHLDEKMTFVHRFVDTRVVELWTYVRDIYFHDRFFAELPR